MTIRALADTHNRGALDIAEFTIAMHLIQSLMNGRISSVPASLPPELVSAANITSPVLPNQFPIQSSSRRTASVSSAGSSRAPTLPPKVQSSPVRANFTGSSQVIGDWDVTTQDKTYFDNLFKGIDTTNKGYIDGIIHFF